MTEHLSTLQIKQLCVSALPGDQLAPAAAHTAACRSCEQQFVEELKRQRGPAPFNFTLEPEFWFRYDHVDFEILVALADKTLDQETEEIINIHLKLCKTCRGDVRNFLAYRAATTGELEISYGPTYYEPPAHIARVTRWQRSQRKPVYAVAAIVLVAVAVLLGEIALNRRSGPLEASQQAQATTQIEGNPGSSSPAPDAVLSPSRVDGSAKVAILKDAGGEVTIDRNGRVTGLDEVSENSREYIARAVLSQRIESPEVLRRLSSNQSGLRGNGNEEGEFRLLYPVRRVLTENRPVFRWQSLSGASSYRVYVLDVNGNQAGQSEELPVSVRQWKAPRLRRGQIFSWLVMALLDGKKVVSPSASAPEMKFAILSTADAQELTRLKKANSHLALGVFYARAGLLDEAEREFETLLKLNPDSEVPTKLLQSLRGISKEN